MSILGVIRLIISDEDFEIFYADNYQVTHKMQSHLDFANVWEENRYLYTSGALTPMIICGEDAIRRWRKIVGPTYPERYQNDPRYADTLRIQFANSVHNNIVHGSDGKTEQHRIESVRYEVAWLFAKISHLFQYLDLPKSRVSLSA